MPIVTFITLLLFIFAVATVYLALPRNNSTLLLGDAAIIAQLRKAGSDLSKTHPVEFFLYFPTEEVARHIAARLVGEGFASKIQPASSGALDWLIIANRNLVPTFEAMSQWRRELSALSKAQGGAYDGWGTPVVK